MKYKDYYEILGVKREATEELPIEENSKKPEIVIID